MNNGCIKAITGCFLVGGLALLLLLLALPRQRPDDRHHVAIVQASSGYIFDETVRGIVKGFEERGLSYRSNIDFEFINLSNDPAVARQTVQSIVRQKYDLIMTVGTIAMQLVSQANINGKRKHVFGAVTDPYSAGVGINARNHLQHPSWMTGIGTFQPVAETIMLARQMNPDLRKIGTIINPQESSSLACVEKARKTARGLGMDLTVVHVGNAAAVPAAVNSLLAQGIEAIFLGGDTTVSPGIEGVVKLAQRQRIPVFSYAPVHVIKGAMAGIGADYFEIGRLQALLAIEILRGLNPAEVPIENILPRKLSLNMLSVEAMMPRWKVPPEVYNSAAVIIDHEGIREIPGKQEKLVSENIWYKFKTKRKNPRQLVYVNFNRSPTCEDNLNGFMAEFEGLGMVIGEDYEIRVFNADGSIPKARELLLAANQSNADLILLATTQVLQAALPIIKTKPVVFSLVSDPVRAGAGKSFSEHRDNFTGVAGLPDYRRAISLIKTVFPAARRLGTLYCPDELNSVVARDRFALALNEEKIELISRPVRFSADIGNETKLLLQQHDIDLFCQISDNLSNSNFVAISEVCSSLKKPLFSLAPGNAISNGAIMAMGLDYTYGGRIQAHMATEIINGKSPADMVFRQNSQTRLVINLRGCRELGINVPADLLKAADQVID